MKTTEMLGTTEEDRFVCANNADVKNAFPLETHEILDRFEYLYPNLDEIADLRRAYVDKDLRSIFKLVTDENNSNLRKLILEDNTWKLWPLLSAEVKTQFIDALKSFYVNDIGFDKDCLSRGQIQSKMWLVKELYKLHLDLGTVFLCAGWYATLAVMLFEKGFRVGKIRSFDIDPTCAEIAETFNKPWFMDQWRFKSITQDIMDIDYNEHTWQCWSNANNRMSYPISDTPDTIINTSCEHIADFDEWYSRIPDGKLVVLQSNNYYKVKEHVNCVKNIKEFGNMARMTGPLFAGELKLPNYTRFMLIGRK